MTPEEIIANHIKNNGLQISAREMIGQLNAASKLPKTKVMRSGDVMFVFSVDNENALVYIINGGGAIGYIKALRVFVTMLKKLEIKTLQMRIQDTQSAKKIAESAGLKNVSFEEVEQNAVDPYLMTAEV